MENLVDERMIEKERKKLAGRISRDEEQNTKRQLELEMHKFAID